MRLASQQYNNIRYNVPNKTNKDGISNTSPVCKDKTNFTSNIALKAADDIIKIAKKGSNIELSNARKLISQLDDLFGNKYFSEKLR